jgi:hypothetical protein
LREAGAFPACYLAALIDIEVERLEYYDEWKKAYAACCSTHIHSLTLLFTVKSMEGTQLKQNMMATLFRSNITPARIACKGVYIVRDAMKGLKLGAVVINLTNHKIFKGKLHQVNNGNQGLIVCADL